MKVLIALVIAIILIILLNDGCCSYVPSTITQTDTLVIYQDPELDTLTLIRTDTVWTATNPKYFVRIDTVKKKVYIDRFKDTLYIPYLDTITIYKPTPKEPGFLDGITLLIIIKIFVVMFITMICIFIYKQLKGIF